MILTDADKALINVFGGFPVGGDWGVVRFNKAKKPNREVKRMLRERGYDIDPKSGSPINAYIDYVLKDYKDQH